MRIKEGLQLVETPMPGILMSASAIVLGILVYGLVILYQDQEAFLVWIREDGLVEWITFGVLLISSLFSFFMADKFKRIDPESAAKGVWLFLGVLFLFGAMEEISWGQRVFGIESPAWFLENNRQQETNIHNLMIFSVNINKLVFGKILGALIAIYLIVVPALYYFNKKSRNFINRYAIPVARNYQVFLAVIVIVILQLHISRASKVGELLEFGNCFLFLLILLHPRNREIFPQKVFSFITNKSSLRNGRVRVKKDVSKGP